MWEEPLTEMNHEEAAEKDTGVIQHCYIINAVYRIGNVLYSNVLHNTGI